MRWYWTHVIAWFISFGVPVSAANDTQKKKKTKKIIEFTTTIIHRNHSVTYPADDPFFSHGTLQDSHDKITYIPSGYLYKWAIFHGYVK